MIADAYNKAQAIAADALDAKRNVETYRLEARALKNVIEGYGDQYLVATTTLLDSLAEGFAHTDAGAKLKEVRKRSRDMVKGGRAAACDYVEEERRVAAVEFVIDAFNGKVETVISKVKVDNFGTLYQQLEDAFAIVNMNGRAFRNARVLRSYFEARVEELRWAVVVQELREQEREEQRLLKEQIREEEKARREFERAQKDAAKEEDVIRRAMAKAQQEIAQATDAQRVKYEAQLQELALRLQAAEEKISVRCRWLSRRSAATSTSSAISAHSEMTCSRSAGRDAWSRWTESKSSAMPAFHSTSTFTRSL